MNSTRACFLLFSCLALFSLGCEDPAASQAKTATGSGGKSEVPEPAASLSPSEESPADLEKQLAELLEREEAKVLAKIEKLRRESGRAFLPSQVARMKQEAAEAAEAAFWKDRKRPARAKIPSEEFLPRLKASYAKIHKGGAYASRPGGKPASCEGCEIGSLKLPASGGYSEISVEGSYCQEHALYWLRKENGALRGSVFESYGPFKVE